MAQIVSFDKPDSFVGPFSTHLILIILCISRVSSNRISTKYMPAARWETSIILSGDGAFHVASICPSIFINLINSALLFVFICKTSFVGFGKIRHKTFSASAAFASPTLVTGQGPSMHPSRSTLVTHAQALLPTPHISSLKPPAATMLPEGSTATPPYRW